MKNLPDVPRELAFRYQRVVLDPSQLRYSPHPDIIHPSVVQSGPDWQNPVAKYFMYYAPHDAPGGICLALADHPEGPWREYEGNPVIGHDWAPHYQVTHVSSPHAIWNPDEKRLFLYFHGENDTTRFATSVDGIHFEYGEIAVRAHDFDLGLTESSYARVFRCPNAGEKGLYWMLLMGTLSDTRCVYQAWSFDGRNWKACPEPLITPPPGTNQMGPGCLLRFRNRNYLIAFANREDAPTYHPISDLYLYGISPDFAEASYLGMFMDHTEAGPENQRINDPFLLQTGGLTHLYLNVGRRLHQSIALALADFEPESVFAG